MDFLNKISENWLKWTSLPFAFALGISFYVFTASELNDLPNVEMGGREYLLLAIPFLLLLLGYLVGCCIHNARSKKEKPQQEAVPEGKTKSARSKKTAWLIFSGCFLAVAVLTFVLMFTPKPGFRDGSYVIWSDEYHIALSPEVHKSYYLEGDPVDAKEDTLADYPKRCVVELDFNKDGTFTIAHNGKLLGVTPGKNGVGYGGESTSVLWELEELDDGVYYAHNVDENTYLKWYEAQENWTSHPNIVDENKQQYRLRLTRVK